MFIHAIRMLHMTWDRAFHTYMESSQTESGLCVPDCGGVCGGVLHASPSKLQQRGKRNKEMHSLDSPQFAWP